jgi:hypothetical protein
MRSLTATRPSHTNIRRFTPVWSIASPSQRWVLGCWARRSLQLGHWLRCLEGFTHGAPIHSTIHKHRIMHSAFSLTPGQMSNKFTLHKFVPDIPYSSAWQGLQLVQKPSKVRAMVSNSGADGAYEA